MSEWKEVWYVWDGDIENNDMSFIKNATKVSFADGSFLLVDEGSPYRHKPVMWYLWGKWCNAGVRFYTLGEKRRRCVDCGGKGKWKENYWFTRECQTCNGTGWEYKK